MKFKITKQEKEWALNVLQSKDSLNATVLAYDRQRIAMNHDLRVLEETMCRLAPFKVGNMLLISRNKKSDYMIVVSISASSETGMWYLRGMSCKKDGSPFRRQGQVLRNMVYANSEDHELGYITMVKPEAVPATKLV